MIINTSETPLSFTMEDPYLNIFNAWLYREWSQLSPEIRHFLTHPYLITPTKEYLKSPIRFLIVNRETNSWGEKEREEKNINALDINELKELYVKHINDNWDNLGTVWPMYYALRQLSEGQNTDSRLDGKVGFLHSNVALIGMKEETGFCNKILSLLIEALDKMIKFASPNVILMGIGFGTEERTEQPYVEILSKTFLGPLIDRKPCDGCNSLFELKFAHQKELTIFGCRHPQGLSYTPIVEYLRTYLIKKLSYN